MVIGHRPSAIGHRPSAIGHRPSAIGRRSSVIGHRPSAIGHRPSVIGHRSSVIGHRPSRELQVENETAPDPNGVMVFAPHSLGACGACFSSEGKGERSTVVFFEAAAGFRASDPIPSDKVMIPKNLTGYNRRCTPGGNLSIKVSTAAARAGDAVGRCRRRHRRSGETPRPDTDRERVINRFSPARRGRRVRRKDGFCRVRRAGRGATWSVSERPSSHHSAW